MPEKPPSSRERPVIPLFAQAPRRDEATAPPPPDEPAYAELLAASNFSFLRGASHPEELAATATELGLAGFSIADRNTLAGIVRGHLAAKTTGARYAVGCRLVFRDGTPDIAVWPTDRAAYGRLCRLLTTGNLRTKKGECHLDLADLLEWGAGMEMAVLSPVPAPAERERGRSQRRPPCRGSELADGRGSEQGEVEFRQQLAGSPSPGGSADHPPLRVRVQSRLGSDARHSRRSFSGPCAARRDLSLPRRRPTALAAIAALAARHKVPMLALGDVLYHAPERRKLQDVLSCVREHKTLETAGRLLEANAERHMKSAAEMARLFAEYPQAITETLAVLERLAVLARGDQPRLRVSAGIRRRERHAL